MTIITLSNSLIACYIAVSQSVLIGERLIIAARLKESIPGV